MRKFSALDALDPPRRKKSKAPLVYFIVLVLIASPPLFELGKLNLARFGLFGLTNPVQTPVLDVLSAGWQTGESDVRDWIAPKMANLRWSPGFVIPIAFFWTAMGALMLRRTHLR
jgi:hypothetical protein